MLCANGAANGANLSAAVFQYNHASWYVSEVLALAQPYGETQAQTVAAGTAPGVALDWEDAHALSRHVAPEVSEHDLSHLAAYTATTRLVVGGEETPAFTLRTRPAAIGSFSVTN
jgi:cytochrome c553